MRLGQAPQVIGKKCDIGRLERNLAARTPHGDADIGAGQCGGIVHAVTDEGDRPALAHRSDLRATLSSGSRSAAISSSRRPSARPIPHGRPPPCPPVSMTIRAMPASRRARRPAIAVARG